MIVLTPSLKVQLDVGGGDGGAGGASVLMLPLLVCNLLLRGYRNHREWPLDFVQVYLMDSFGARHWVDHDLAAGFVAGVVTAFDSQLAPAASRYPNPQAQDKIRAVTLNLLRGNIERQDNVRGLVRALTTLSTYDEGRFLAARRLLNGAWLQDPNLVRHVKELFEALCARIHLDTPFDLDAMRFILAAVASSTMPQSYLSEHLQRLLQNNPSYSKAALFFGLSSDSSFSHEVVRAALAVLPSDAVRGRACGHALYRSCMEEDAGPARAQRLLSMMPRLSRVEMCIGLLERASTVAPRLVATFKTILLFQLVPDLVETYIPQALSAGLSWAVALKAPLPALRDLLLLNNLAELPALSCSEDVLAAVSGTGSMTMEILDAVFSLVLRSARAGLLHLSPSFAPVLLERILAVPDWLAAMTACLIAVLAPKSAGLYAIKADPVKRMIMMLVTRRFEGNSVADIPPQMISMLQSIPSLSRLACFSRDPDYVVMTLQTDPSAVDLASNWLPPILEHEGADSFLGGIPPDAAATILLVACAAGPSSPLVNQMERLAGLVDLADDSVAKFMLRHLLQPRASQRGPAHMAFGMCKGVLDPKYSLVILEGVLGLETDAKAMVSVLTRCSFSGVEREAQAIMLKQLAWRSGLRQCIKSYDRLQEILVSLWLAGDRNVPADALVSLLGGNTRDGLLKVSGSLPKPKPALAKVEPARESRWWWNCKPSPVSRSSSAGFKQVAAPTLPPVPAWDTHIGVIEDLKPARMPDMTDSSELSGAIVPSSTRYARNAVLSIMSGGPLAPLACRALLRYRPDPATATTLVQFAVSTRPVNLEALLAACKCADLELTTLSLAVDALLQSPPGGLHEEAQVRAFVNLVNKPGWRKADLRKLLATRGGMSWENAANVVERHSVLNVLNIVDAVGKLQDPQADRRAAYETLLQALPAGQDLILREWRLAVQSPVLEVMRDALAAASSFHLLLGESAGVREWLVKVHGPRAAADCLRAMLVVKGYGV